MPNTHIVLPFSRGPQQVGNHDDGFWSDALVRHLRNKPNHGIEFGGADQVLAQHPKPDSMDYWLRVHYVQQPNTRQICIEVKEELRQHVDFDIRQVPNNLSGVDPEWVFLVP